MARPRTADDQTKEDEPQEDPRVTAEREAADAIAKESATNVALAWRSAKQQQEAQEAGYEELLKDYDAEQKKKEKEETKEG